MWHIYWYICSNILLLHHNAVTYCYCITLKAITGTYLKSVGMLADDLGSRSLVKSYTCFKGVKGG